MCKTAIMANVRNAGGATGPLRVAGRESQAAPHSACASLPAA